MALNRTPPLDERIANIRADLEAWVAARVAEDRKRWSDLPDSMVRADLMRGMCLCSAFLDIKKRDDEQAARETAA